MAETEQEETKRGPGRPKMVTVKIREFRGKPAVGGIFLESHEGLSLEQMHAGQKEYKKLLPGKTTQMSEKDYDELPPHAREALEIVRE